MSQGSITVRELLEEGKEKLKLSLLSGRKGLWREITNPMVHRPGLLLSGFTEDFDSGRVQLLGAREIRYLNSLQRSWRKEAIDRLFASEVPAVVVTGRKSLPNALRTKSRAQAIPLIKSELDSGTLLGEFSEFISERLAPVQVIHGTLVDIYGVGVLLTGRSGIGKSEIALDLVSRGHVLVADDVVRLRNHPKGTLTGSSGSSEWRLRHFIEVRGLGLIDIRALFGIQAVRDAKRVEVHVELVDWSETLDYERIGLKDAFSEFAGVEVQYLRLPLNPGKNIGSLLETIAKTYHLKLSGYHPPQTFENILLSSLEERRKEGKRSENSKT
jgi:HPr kinase/phosphorylase